MTDENVDNENECKKIYSKNVWKRFNLEKCSISENNDFIFLKNKGLVSEICYEKDSELEFRTRISLTENLTEEMSELIGILLGDGLILYDTIKHRYLFSIYFNGVDEVEYLIYVKKFLIDIYKKSPIENWERDKPTAKDNAKGVSLTLYGKEIVEGLLELGLKSGNKVMNQVGVPSCVFEEKKFIIKCLKGLFDTDGSLFLNKSRKSIYLSYSSGSMNLVKGFIKLCKKIEINAHFYGAYDRMNKKTGTISKEYLVHISQKEMVKKFLNIINPEKWKNNNRREFIGTLLILLKNSENYNDLIREYNLLFQNKQFRYSLQSLKFLRIFCKNIKLQVTNSLIKSAIKKSFEFKYLNYSIEYAEYLKELSIKKGSIREVVKTINKKYRITANNYIKRLFLEFEYLDLYGDQGYSRWLNHNFEVIVDNFYDTNINKRIIRVRRFSFDIKKKICILIFNILRSSNSQKSNSNIKKELSYLIHNLDLNSRLVKEENLPIPIEKDIFKPKVLLFERLSFLLNNSEYTSVINDHFSILIIYMKEILKLINSKKKLSLENLRKHLRNNLNINWRSDNIKKILIALNIYKKLIFET
jgi:hypothetical protein